MKLRRRWSSRLVAAISAAGLVLSASYGCTSASSPDAPAADSAPQDDASRTSPAEGGGSDVRADSSSAPDADASQEVVAPAKCFAYCDKLAVICTGDLIQFSTMNACLRACSFYEPGMVGDATGSSFICRMFHLNAGESTPEDKPGHCFHAGLFGYAGCGEPCDTFCPFAMSWCAGSPSGAPYPSLAACMTTCSAYPSAPASTPGGQPYNALLPASGDSIECRQFHLVRSLESIAARDAHCANVGAVSPACK